MALTNITTKADFDDRVLNGKNLVLVDFWAQWCPPCRAMAPVLEELAKKHGDKLDVVKIDIDASQDNSNLANEHKVMGIPNMLVFKDGQVVKQFVGMQPLTHLERELSPIL